MSLKMFMQNLEAVQLHVFAYRISAVCGKTFKVGLNASPFLFSF
jgi:hypothetical protein